LCVEGFVVQESPCVIGVFDEGSHSKIPEIKGENITNYQLRKQFVIHGLSPEFNE
jgi:hypothetical protein